MEWRDSRLVPVGQPEPRPGDVASPEAVVGAVYDVISGPAEKERPRDWDRLHSLFLPGARLVIARWRTPDGEDLDELHAWDVEGFIEAARDHYRNTAFYEREIAHRMERFGNIAHVFSSYESRVGSPDSDPVARGINSIQTARTGGRWWIAHLVWDVEGRGNAIPEAYL